MFVVTGAKLRAGRWSCKTDSPWNTGPGTGEAAGAREREGGTLGGQSPRVSLTRHPGCEPWGFGAREITGSTRQEETGGSVTGSHSVSSRWVWKREMLLAALQVHLAVLSWLQGGREHFGDISKEVVRPMLGVVGICGWPSGTGRGPWSESVIGHSNQRSV